MVPHSGEGLNISRGLPFRAGFRDDINIQIDGLMRDFGLHSSSIVMVELEGRSLRIILLFKEALKAAAALKGL